MRHLLATVVALALGVLTVLALGGQSRLDGDIIVTLSSRHGLHEGDLLALGVAVVGLTTLAVLHHLARRRPRRGAARGTADDTWAPAEGSDARGVGAGR